MPPTPTKSYFVAQKIFNFLWVFLLTVFRVNYSAIHYTLFIIEIALIIFLYKDKFIQRNDKIAENLKGRWKETQDKFLGFFGEDPQVSGFVRLIKSLIIVILFAWVVSCFIWIFKFSFDNLNTVFQRWDAVV